jgi:hypothetical protein
MFPVLNTPDDIYTPHQHIIFDQILLYVFSQELKKQETWKQTHDSLCKQTIFPFPIVFKTENEQETDAANRKHYILMPNQHGTELPLVVLAFL